MLSVYYRNGRFLIPTVAKTEAGFFLDVAPVLVLQQGQPEALAEGLRKVILAGNPVVLTPTRGSFPKPVVLEPAGVKSWSAFEKKSICWTITKAGDQFEVSVTSRNSKGGWADNPAATVKIPEHSGPAGLAACLLSHLAGRGDV